MSLLIAALLYFCGAALGPVAHLHGAEWVSVPTLTESDSSPGSPAPHSELGCFVCQALGALAVPAGEPPATPLASEDSGPGPRAEAITPSPHTSPPRARAPPIA